MNLLLFLLHLTAAVMLLLYSTRMVRTGIERAAGPAIRRMMLRTRNHTLLNITSGTAGAVLLQSSTAVILLVSGFAASGVIGSTAALAMAIGADLGTTLVVQFLSLDLSFLIPVLIAAGGILFLKFDSRLVKQNGRVLLGIGFILISLQMISDAAEPLRTSDFVTLLINHISDDILTAFIGGLVITFIFHSSVAAVLLFATFSSIGLIPLHAGIWLVLGANAGGALIVVWLTRSAHARAKRLTMANLIIRTSGAVVGLAFVSAVDLSSVFPDNDPARQLINFHFIFNLALLVLAFPFLSSLSRLMEHFYDDAQTEEEPIRPVSALDRNVLDHPRLALASVTREVLRMSEQVEIMLQPLMECFDANNPDQLTRVRKMDDYVNEAHTDIKLYLAELNQRHLTCDESQRSMELLNFTINQERVGDIIAKDLIRLATEKHKRGLSFSDAGWVELTDLHARVMSNVHLALNVLISEDVETARLLVEEKEKLRELEQRSHDRHMARLGLGTPESIATSDLHLEIIRALKEINSRFAAYAYPVLNKYGELLDSRLIQRAS